MVLQIKVSDSLTIPCGNFAFIDGAAKSPKFTEKCLELEQTLKQDYAAFAHKYRLVLEEFALSEETYRRIVDSGMRYNEQTTRERITREIKNKEVSYPDLVTRICLSAEKKDAFEAYLQRMQPGSGKWSQQVYEEELWAFIRSLFRFGSQNSHSGEKSSELTANDEICKDYLRKMHSLFSIYYGNTKKFDGSRIPFADYYPVSKAICKDNGLFLPEKKYLFVRQGERGVEYYIFTNAETSLSDTQKRDIDTIHRLWVDNMDSPQNVITSARFLANKNNTDYRYWASPIPSFPHSLTDEYISSLSGEQRSQIVHGIVRGVASMHHADPPFYHRALSASSFIVCEVRGRPKVMLLSFDCAKDTDESAAYTVFYAVSDKLSKEETPDQMFAPEIISLNDTEEADLDWAKVDIFALSKTILKVFTNSYACPDSKPDNLGADKYNLLCCMCADDPSKRPTIEEVEQLF